MNKAAVIRTIVFIGFAASYGFWFRNGMKLADWCFKKETKDTESTTKVHHNFGIEVRAEENSDPVCCLELADSDSNVTDVYLISYKNMDLITNAYLQKKRKLEAKSES